MTCRRWSKSECNELERLHALGLKPMAISKSFDRSYAAVKAKLISMGLVGDRRRDALASASATGPSIRRDAIRLEKMNTAFTAAMERAGYVRFRHNGPPDIVFREPIWRGAA